MVALDGPSSPTTTTTTTAAFRPSRISSEAPEVVQAPEPSYPGSNSENIPLSPITADAQKDNIRTTTSSPWREEEDREDTEFGTLDGRVGTFRSKKTFDERKWRRRRIIFTVVAIVVAFLVGGGVGGGVGTAVASNKSAPTVTVTAANPNPTTILDYAGCPSVNNVTYISPQTGKRFLKICGTEIVAPEGQNIDMGNSVESTFNNCLDACAERDGCVGATWFIFSAANPKKNSVCYFKDGAGNATSGTAPGQQLASGILRS